MQAETPIGGSPQRSTGGSATADPRAHAGVRPELIGARVREERLRHKIGLRELARRIDVSASFISQIELGKASPSVGTLYAIVNELGISLDELFFQAPSGDGSHGSGAGSSVRALTAGDADGVADADGHPRPRAGAELIRLPTKAPPVVYETQARSIYLASGVRWKRLSPETPQDVDFLEVTYEVGSESCPADALMCHSGHEYGYILQGRMGVTVGFDSYELGPGDSIAFDSTMPHRLYAVGQQPTRAIWVVVGRRGDPRLTRP
ncbi:MAG: helix-turn-helix domain-containing protein [Solirubrobacteraceae bacterium]